MGTVLIELEEGLRETRGDQRDSEGSEEWWSKRKGSGLYSEFLWSPL